MTPGNPDLFGQSESAPPPGRKSDKARSSKAGPLKTRKAMAAGEERVKQAKVVARAAQAERIAAANQALTGREVLSVAQVVLPTPVDRTFDYLIPAPLERDAVRGARAVVPFGKRTLTGFIVGVSHASELPKSKLKPILELPDPSPLVDEDMLKLTEWIGGYYACSWGEALQAVLPAVIRRGRALRTVGVLRLSKGLELTEAHAANLEGRARGNANSPLLKQAKVLRTVLTFGDENWRPSVLAEKLGFSESPIATLRKEGWLEIEKVPLEDDVLAGHTPDGQPGPLTVEQAAACAEVETAIRAGEYRTFLLRGVTGSGKTEVYIQAVEQVLAAGRSAIVLVPEISLTPQTVHRFSGRLSARYGVAVLHSAMTDSDRRREWRRIESGEARIVIGPRSAVFAPVRKLGLIVVDEEHEPSYKQEHTPRYHARDVAVMRCHKQSAVCLLGSATPSLESAHNAISKRYHLLELRSRVLERRLPSVAVIDMAEECRQQKRFAMLSNTLLAELFDCTKAGEQAVMFLNRRGYHAFYQCNNCRELLHCPNCDAPMHHHRMLGLAVCHYCLETMPPPPRCPACNAGVPEPKGMGTELLEEELLKAVPGLRIARMDSDVMKSREDYEEVLSQFRAGEFNVLVGTQMIAKGLDFPNVTLVGVVQADLSSQLADFRAQERSFQLLTQVAGRAGRGHRPGRVIVQTFAPNHPCILFARSQDYWGFFRHEVAARQLAKYPPFVRLLNITIEARDEGKGKEVAKLLRARADDWDRRHPGEIVSLLGPSVAPVSRIRNRHRWQFLIKAANQKAMRLICDHMKSEVKLGESLRVTLDVDPYSMV